MRQKFLAALPVFNEVDSVESVLNEVVRYSPDVLVIDDGSSDGTAEKLSARDDIILIQHPKNRGYGGALATAFDYAIEHEYEVIVTIDCDGQHEPQRIQQFVTECYDTGADIVSGSRYLESFVSDSPPPEQRRKINFQITKTLNDKLGFDLTDAFCGFKAYRVEALRRLNLTETGYAMPLELWVQAACQKLSVVEVAVPLIYLDESRSFGDKLDDPEIRIAYYNDVLTRSFARLPSGCDEFKRVPTLDRLSI